MSYAVLAQLIIHVGLPLALKIAEKWNSNDLVTQADIDELKALGAKTPRTQMLDALTSSGVSHDDPKAVALLALVGPGP